MGVFLGDFFGGIFFGARLCFGFWGVWGFGFGGCVVIFVVVRRFGGVVRVVCLLRCCFFEVFLAGFFGGR